MHAVANRQISRAAGQGNNAAVTYHFGTKAGGGGGAGAPARGTDRARPGPAGGAGR
ncbi:hypothetical protein [Streptomyces sp. 4F14]|uniref:hypothetical protein n=1 Tax=Streptomyces sp. 4F14 TaxID=3394380 RepID=UPI003A841582